MIHHDLRTKLLSDSDITNLIGTRILPLHDKQSSPWPKILYRLVSEQNDYSAGGNTGPTEDVIEFDCQAESYDTAKLLDVLVADNLDAFRGQAGSSFIQGCFTENVADDVYQIGEGGDGYIYTVTRQMKVVYG